MIKQIIELNEFERVSLFVLGPDKEYISDQFKRFLHMKTFFINDFNEVLKDDIVIVLVQVKKVSFNSVHEISKRLAIINKDLYVELFLLIQILISNNLQTKI